MVLDEVVKALQEEGIKLSNVLAPNAVVVYVSGVEEVPLTFGRWIRKTTIAFGLMSHSHSGLLELRDKVTEALKKHFVTDSGYRFKVQDDDIRVGVLELTLDEEISEEV